MNEISIRRNWYAGIVVLILVGGALLIMLYLVLKDMISSVISGTFPPGSLTLPLIIFYIIVSLMLIYLCSLPFVDLFTKFTDSGVWRPTFYMRSTFIPWSSFKKIIRDNWTVTLVASNRTIHINLLLFKDPEELVAEIEKRIPDVDFGV